MRRRSRPPALPLVLGLREASGWRSRRRKPAPPSTAAPSSGSGPGLSPCWCSGAGVPVVGCGDEEQDPLCRCAVPGSGGGGSDDPRRRAAPVCSTWVPRAVVATEDGRCQRSNSGHGQGQRGRCRGDQRRVGGRTMSVGPRITTIAAVSAQQGEAGEPPRRSRPGYRAATSATTLQRAAQKQCSPRTPGWRRGCRAPRRGSLEQGNPAPWRSRG